MDQVEYKLKNVLNLYLKIKNRKLIKRNLLM